ncbi:hypothetical protein TRFO_16047 [Tritrichomonas foetus]|uniref:Uncharacterized protein n=1 Tax=Tritrichomonas foetus TaxID=1144522 RepID=A0A1J4KW37_9EUKA|nr:hypothetical protein TRFO_16047 [Tritrichomonas foetus]|eukprot:OHT13725.1 hypothetical protein TRFO_16047 [Tritrichomonas foetus]
MIGTREWTDMIEEEIKELQRLIDRKAEKKELLKYKAIIKSQCRNITFKNANNETNNMIDDISSLKDQNNQSFEHLYRFGVDLSSDFSMLFGIFNRMVKKKLDNNVISDFASVTFVDLLTEKRSIDFSLHLSDSCNLYRKIFGIRIEKLAKEMKEFHIKVIDKLNEIDHSANVLHQRLNKLSFNKHGLKYVALMTTKEGVHISSMRSEINMSDDFKTIDEIIENHKTALQKMGKTLKGKKQITFD